MTKTIKEIAVRAGVSKSTVSRVISGNGYTSQEARDKVIKAIEELQYKPNAVARAMVSKRTKNIGVIIYRMQPPIASHPFYGKIVDAIISASESLGYSVFVTTDHEMSLRSADYMLEKRVDGLILISSLRQNVIDHIQKFGVPYLMVNGSTNDDNVIHIVNRDETGGKLAAEYLYSRGHRKICVIAGPQEHRSHYLRLKGFRSFLHDRGLSLEEAHILQSPTSAFESGYKILTECVDQILASDRTAIFATNDTLALGAMKVLLEKGIRIPDEIAVIGFDDIDMASMYTPSLTTVYVEKFQMGYDSVMMLDRLIKQEKTIPKTLEYDPKLIIRKST